MKKIRMKSIYKSLLLLAGVIFSFSAYSARAKGDTARSYRDAQQQNLPGIAANCAPSQEIVYLDFNNVRALIETGGIMWQDRANQKASYEIPKKPLTSNEDRYFALYSGGLWMAGQDVNGQLKAAVSKFGQGTDYWTGPLTNGSAEITPEVCNKYDRFFQISRAEVALFVAYNQAKANGEAAIKFPGYTIPRSILEWPGNNEGSNLLDLRLAPFEDVGVQDLIYDPVNSGDYPYYDLNGDRDCRAPRKDRSITSTRPLFGDMTYWWVFNDKGNIHTESNAPPIGMEVHAQAFAFATNDEINNMTFYNYELINRSTFTLTNTYFASWVDPDLGNPQDDYVGCDVERGLGYAYNGDSQDEPFRGNAGYGSTPPAIGIDFFEGPYQDNDGKDNPLTTDIATALLEKGIPYGGIGIGYGDSIVDNERFGMRKFVYYNIGPAQNGDPVIAAHYYQYMTGFWKNNQRMRFGGDAFTIAPGSGVENIESDYMFPGTSDPYNWGTKGIEPSNQNWTEYNTGGSQNSNAPGDRRFLQSAGPFTLLPGNVNDITVGVVFAQAQSGDNLASISDLLRADDKAQSLFDNCFQVLDGPDAPDVAVQELDQEIILYLSNENSTSNNYRESYEEVDPDIITPEDTKDLGIEYDKTYNFEGYRIYQLKNPEVSIEDIGKTELVRLVAQTDIKNNVGRLINYNFDSELGSVVPVVEADSVNLGIQHSFSIKTDQFAEGDKRLVNYKTYYFMVIAYGYNEFKKYKQDAPRTVDLTPGSDGQKMPFISSRRSSTGGDVRAIAAIPHKVQTEAGGTVVRANYGDNPQIKRIEGRGNGGNIVRITNKTEERILVGNDLNPFEEDLIEYERGQAPIDVYVADPLNIQPGNYYVQLLAHHPDSSLSAGLDSTQISQEAVWRVWREYMSNGNLQVSDTIYARKNIGSASEQLLTNPNLGFSLRVELGTYPGRKNAPRNGYLGAEFEFKDPSKRWLGGIGDVDGFTAYNWIRSGNLIQKDEDPPEYADYYDFIGVDNDQNYERILGGIIAPYTLAAWKDAPYVNAPGFSQGARARDSLSFLHSVKLVFTKDKSKWTRVPVFETQELTSRSSTGTPRLHVKKAPSVDKEGNRYVSGGISSNPEDAGFIDTAGMGWFPGYAINLETGTRLNMGFGEDSFYGTNNGDDMLWNPTAVREIGIDPRTAQLIWGGKHFIYVFRETNPREIKALKPFGAAFVKQAAMPKYDYGEQLMKMMRSTNFRLYAWGSVSWVMLPMLAEGQELLSTDASITINVTTPLDTMRSAFVGENADNKRYKNNGMPVFTFNADNFFVQKNVTSVLEERLGDINVVPNPYYAYSQYEKSRNDNMIKIINLPEVCTVKIYNVNGTLIREFRKADPSTYINWDLNNHVKIPVASGVYLIHVSVPDVGEKVIKWFGVMRPTDLNTF